MQSLLKSQCTNPSENHTESQTAESILKQKKRTNFGSIMVSELKSDIKVAVIKLE